MSAFRVYKISFVLAFEGLNYQPSDHLPYWLNSNSYYVDNDRSPTIRVNPMLRQRLSSLNTRAILLWHLPIGTPSDG
jgi:hypothetical protein